MSEWTEYNITMEWPKGDNIDYQVRLDGKWGVSTVPIADWEDGQRIRFRVCEPEMMKVHFSDKTCIWYHPNRMPDWVRLAAPIAAYHKGMKYMALDGDGEVYVYEQMPSVVNRYWEKVVDTECALIASIPKEAMPDDWKTAIVELVHEEGEV
jgi:hypothetical protein